MEKAMIMVRADWDPEALVWVASSNDIFGLNVEAESLEELAPKVIGAITDLLEVNGYTGNLPELPVHISAERIGRVPTPRAA